MMYHDRPDFGRLFTLSYLLANKCQRRWMTAAYIGIPACACLILFLVCHPYRAETTQYPDAYSIAGTESKQAWTIREDDFVSLVSERLPASAPTLAYLREPERYDTQRMLSSNGETWRIVFNVVPDNAAGNPVWRKYMPDVREHLGCVSEVKLSLYQDADLKYVRTLVGIFNPGAEDYVINKLHLDGNTKNASKVKVGNVLYTYASTGPALIIEPDT